jgi:hypothetical protein
MEQVYACLCVTQGMKAGEPLRVLILDPGRNLVGLQARQDRSASYWEDRLSIGTVGY